MTRATVCREPASGLSMSLLGDGIEVLRRVWQLLLRPPEAIAVDSVAWAWMERWMTVSYSCAKGSFRRR